MIAYESECGKYKVRTIRGGMLKTKYIVEGGYSRGKVGSMADAMEWIKAHKFNEAKKADEANKPLTSVDVVSMLFVVGIILYVVVPFFI